MSFGARSLPAAMGNPGCAIRPARPGDLTALTEIERLCFSDPWSQELLAVELQRQDAALLVACRLPDGPVVGFAAARTLFQQAELLRLAVVPAARRRRLGRSLLTAILDHVRRRGATRCFLEVRPANLAARRLYEQAGFVLQGRRPGYYRDRSDALVYSLEL